MSAFVIIVDFRLNPGTRSDFRRLVDVNARLSAETERGCRRFDVIEPHGEADRVLLYEVYDDEAAFDEHRKSRHYAQFEAESASLVDSKAVIQCDLVCEGHRGEANGEASARE